MSTRKSKAPFPTIIEALEDRQLLGRNFPELTTWRSWLVFLKALFALPMSSEDLEIFTLYTGRKQAPDSPVWEAWLIVGRRGGKSIIAALNAVFLAFFRDYSKVLSNGERGIVMVIAQDRRQARVIFRYVMALIDNVPMLSSMVSRRGKEAIHLNNGISIEIHTCSFRSVRGYTVVAAICDEIAFWRDETSANPDEEIISSIKPGMATIPDSLLLCISSPYARRGALWKTYKRYFGKDDDRVLVWQAPTEAMNPTVDLEFIAEAYDEDESSASSEYGAAFRRDIESFVSIEAVEACVVPERRVLPPGKGVRYFAFVDPSGGSQDSMTLSLAHRDQEEGFAVLDLVLERRPPFSPEDVVEEFCSTLEQYGVSSVVGDRYGGEWPREQFRKHGVSYEPSELSKSDIYRELLPLINSGKVELLDDRRLISQLVQLERRTSRSGKDTIDHAPGARDDLANAAAGALLLASKHMGNMTIPLDSELRRPSPFANN
jgi:hypothetical protein